MLYIYVRWHRFQLMRYYYQSIWTCLLLVAYLWLCSRDSDWVELLIIARSSTLSASVIASVEHRLLLFFCPLNHSWESFVPVQCFSFLFILAQRLRLQNTPTSSLQRAKTPPTSVMLPCRLGQQNTSTTSLVYDTKQSDGEAPVIIELWRIQRTPLLPSLESPLGPGVIASDRVLWC